MNLNYNNDFIPSYNIFNINQSLLKGNIGISNNNPKGLLEINGLTNVKHNLIVSNKIYYNNVENIDKNSIYILNTFKSNKINISELKLHNQTVNNKWIIKNNQLKLELKEELKNDIIEYISEIFFINNNIENINIFLNRTIFLTHIFIEEKEISNIISNIKINQKNITLIKKINNKLLCKINQEIILESYHNIITINNIELNNNIQLLGRYDEHINSYWYKNNNNVYINKRISIFSNNTINNNELFIKGNVLINNNLNTINIIGNNLNIIKNINIENILKIKNIESINKLKLNIKNLNINSNIDYIYDINKHFIGNTIIDNSGLFNIKNLKIKNNLNFINNLSQIYHNKSYSKILIDNDINIYYDLYSKEEIDNHIDIEPSHTTNILKLNKDKLYLNSKCYIGNNNISDNFRNQYNIGIFYNTTITGNLYCNNKITFTNNNILNRIISYNRLLKSTVNNINSYNININNINSFNINVNNINSNFLILKNSNNISNNIVGSIFINNEKKLLGNNNNFFRFSLDDDLPNISKYNINNISTTNIKLPLIDSINQYYIYSNLIGTLRFNNNKLQINDGNYWNNLLFDTLHNKNVKIINIYNKSYNNFEIIIPPNKYYNIYYLDNTKIKLIETNIINNKSFKIIFNKIYSSNNISTNIKLINIIKENNNTYIADNMLFDYKLNNNLIYVHLRIDYSVGYFVLLKQNEDNLYKIDYNYTNYNYKYWLKKNINNKLLHNNNENNNEIDIYLINLKEENFIVTCSLFYSYNYEISYIDINTNLIKLEFSKITTNNTFHVIDNHIATSIINKTSLKLKNLQYDNINKYFTANIVINISDENISDENISDENISDADVYNDTDITINDHDILYNIQQGKLLYNDTIIYTIKNKKRLDTDLFGVWIEKYNI